MNTGISVTGEVLRVELVGELDHHSVSQIRERIVEEYSRGQCRDIIFDFSGLTFMDSAGVGMLIGRYKQVCVKGGSVYAVGISPVIERIFVLSGLDKIIKRCSEVSAAGVITKDRGEVI